MRKILADKHELLLDNSLRLFTSRPVINFSSTAFPRFQSSMRRLLLGFLCVFVLTNFNLQAQDPSFEGRKVTEVDVRYSGNQSIPKARILALISTKPGQTYRLERLDEDLKNLYASGLVEDVIFLAEESGEDSVRIIAEITTRPLLAGVGFEGTLGEKERDLRQETELVVGQVVSDQAILNAVTKLEKRYTELGYPDVFVSHRLQPTPREGYQDIIFEIMAGERNTVRKIKFKGNENITGPELRREMDTKEKGILSFITKSGRLDSYKLEEDFEKLITYYNNRGFLNAKILGYERIPVKDDKVDIVIDINEGNTYTVRNLRFKDLKVFKPEELMPGLTLLGGDPFSGQKLSDDVRMVRSYYGSRGYADAIISPEIEEVGNNQIDITYTVVPGDVFRVGKVTIEGNIKTQDRVIRRELPLIPGDNLNTVDLEAAERRLMNIRYFDRVDVQQTDGDLPGFRDINVSVQERNTGSLSFGVGASSIDQVVGFVRFEQSNFDIKNPWSFTGAGQRLIMNLQAGNLRQDFMISLVEPWFLGRRLALGGEAYFRNQLFLSDIFDQESLGAAIFLRKPLTTRSFIRTEYRIENIDVQSSPAAAAAVGAGTYLRSAARINYIYDSRDDNILPRKGHRFDAGITYAGGILGGDVDAVSFDVSGQKHWNLPYDLIFTLDGAVGITDGFGNTPQPPIFERRFLGGPRNLRGFDFWDVGGSRFNNSPLGGLTSAFITTEVTFPIFEEIRGAVFYDMGIVNDDAWDFSTDEYLSDAGIGLRMNLPFGPIAVDYAIPIEKGNTGSSGGRFQFYVNTNF